MSREEPQVKSGTAEVSYVAWSRSLNLSELQLPDDHMGRETPDRRSGLLSQDMLISTR